MSSHQYELSDPPADAISSVKFAPGESTKLLVSSWDKYVYLYDIAGSEDGVLVKKFEHRAPVLDVCWGKDEKEAFSVGLDCDVRRIDLETSEQTVLSTHKAGAKAIVYSPEHDLLISGSWDSTLHLHFPSQADTPAHAGQAPNTVPLPSKVFSLALSPTKLVVAMASRQNHIYDLRTLALLAAQEQPAHKGTLLEEANVLRVEPWQQRESSLKFMTRAVACVSNDSGFASSSIEGRVAVEWFDPSQESQGKKYAFKCHRLTVDGVDVVYPVNALVFHPKHVTFATGGGDGVVSLWDGLAKRRIRQYQKFPSSVAALSFSGDGKYLAIGISPGFEDGQEDMENGVVKVYVRELGENEAKGKDKS